MFRLMLVQHNSIDVRHCFEIQDHALIVVAVVFLNFVFCLDLSALMNVARIITKRLALSTWSQDEIVHPR